MHPVERDLKMVLGRALLFSEDYREVCQEVSNNDHDGES